MTMYLAYICGHILNLGYEELYACLEAEEIDYKIQSSTNQMVIFTSKENPTKAASRCGFLHSIVQIIATGLIDENDIVIEKEYKTKELESNKTFRVRVQRIGPKETKLPTPEMERKLANYVYSVHESSKLETDLSNPDYRFIAFIHKNKFFLGFEMWSVDRNKFKEREPGK